MPLALTACGAIVAAIQHLIARTAFDPFVGVFSVKVGEDALFCSELFVPLALEVCAGVDVARASHK